MPQEMSAQVAVHHDAVARLSEIVREFADAGFTAGPLVGNSFSISAPVHVFEAYFGQRLADVPPSRLSTLPVNAVGPAVRPLVVAIVFTPGYEPFR
jgi:hypothetical protein